MSKSAIKSLTKAQIILTEAGVKIDLVKYITDKELRKNWRNADALAALIIDSAANAVGSENSETIADSYYDDLTDAVQCYIDANLEDWTQKKAAHLELDSEEEHARLWHNILANVAFEKRAKDHAEALEMNVQFDSVEYPRVTPDCFHEAREMNRLIGNADLIAESGFCQADRDYLLAVNARLHPELLAFDIQEAHAEALEVNALVDEAVSRGTYSTSPNLNHIGIRNAADRIRETLLETNRFTANFIVKMMVSVKRLTKISNEEAQAKYREQLAQPRSNDAANEIPY